MNYEHILVEKENGVAILTLNRPEHLNAMNRQLSLELHDAVQQMDADPAIGCIVVTGTGDRAFPRAATSTSSARTIESTRRRSWTRAPPSFAGGATRSARPPSRRSA